MERRTKEATNDEDSNSDISNKRKLNKKKRMMRAGFF